MGRIKKFVDEYLERFDELLIEVRDEGFKEGYDVGYGDRGDEVDGDAYEVDYMEGFSDAMNGRMSEVEDVFYIIDGKFVPSEEINTDGKKQTPGQCKLGDFND